MSNRIIVRGHELKFVYCGCLGIQVECECGWWDVCRTSVLAHESHKAHRLAIAGGGIGRRHGTETKVVDHA